MFLYGNREYSESQWHWHGEHFTDINTLRPRQNGRHFADDTFKRTFLNENVLISIKFSLKFVPKDPINNIPALVQIMAWRRPGDKPLSEPRMVSLPTYICVTRPQWVKDFGVRSRYVRHERVIASHGILWYAITCLCLRHLLLAPKVLIY